MMILVHNVDGAVKGKAGCAGVGRVLRNEKVKSVVYFLSSSRHQGFQLGYNIGRKRVWSFLVSHSMTQLAKTKLNKDIQIAPHGIPTKVLSCFWSL